MAGELSFPLASEKRSGLSCRLHQHVHKHRLGELICGRLIAAGKNRSPQCGHLLLTDFGTPQYLCCKYLNLGADTQELSSVFAHMATPGRVGVISGRA
jgi:hypothetical protein